MLSGVRAVFERLKSRPAAKTPVASPPQNLSVTQILQYTFYEKDDFGANPQPLKKDNTYLHH